MMIDKMEAGVSVKLTHGRSPMRETDYEVTFVYKEDPPEEVMRKLLEVIRRMDERLLNGRIDRVY